MNTKISEKDFSLIQQRDRTPIGQLVPPPYFFGVKKNWDYTILDAFSSVGWIDHCETAARSLGAGFLSKSIFKVNFKNILKRMWSGEDVPRYLSMPLGLLREIFKQNDSVRVLDIGGGYGDNYHLLRRNIVLSAKKKLIFDVVDNERSCQLGRRLFEYSEEIFFHKDIPTNDCKLIIIVGTIQYIPNWRDFLLFVSKLKSKFIYISRTPIRLDGPTFISTQSICPAFGSQSLRKVGEANVSVVGWDDLENSMREIGYIIKEKKLNSDYSKNFSRLPVEYRNIAYVDSMWVSKNF